MRGMRRACAIGLAVLASGCGSFAGDMTMMCDAPKHVTAGAPRSAERAEAMSLYITERTRSAEARRVFQALGSVDKEGRRKLLEDSVRRAGIDPADCEMLAEFE